MTGHHQYLRHHLPSPDCQLCYPSSSLIWIHFHENWLSGYIDLTTSRCQEFVGSTTLASRVGQILILVQVLLGNESSTMMIGIRINAIITKTILIFCTSIVNSYCLKSENWKNSCQLAFIPFSSFQPKLRRKPSGLTWKEVFVVAVSNDDDETERDTIRVRIWRALASGEEISLRKLGQVVGERKDLNSHLVHVERQAKTLKNKSNEWRARRGLQTTESSKNNKLRLIRRRGTKNEVYVRLG